MLSARNQFQGKVKAVKKRAVMAEVIVNVGELEFVSLISVHSTDAMALKKGDDVTVIVKATEVMVAKP
jgi:molybdopterin-binding protein